VLQGNSIAVNGVRAQLADLELSDARAKQTPSPSPLSSSQGTSGTQVNAVRAHIELSDARAKQRDLETRLASLTTEKKAKEMELSIALARIAILEAEKLDQEEEELVTHRATARNLQQSINDYKREAIGLEKLKIAMRDELKSKMVRKLDDNASSSSPRSATSDFTTENESSSEEDDEDAYALKLEEAAVDFTKLDDSSLDVQAALAERKRRTARRRAPASDRNGVPGDGKRLGSVSTAGSSAAAASGPSDSTGLKSSKSRRMNGSSSTTEDPESTSALAISHGSQLPDSIGAIVASPSKGSLKKLKGSASSGSKAAGGGRKANSSKSSLTGSVRKIDAIVWFKTHYIASCQQKGTKAVDDLLMALDRAISKGRRLTALDLNHYDLEPSDIMTLAIAFEKTRMDMEKVSHPSKKSDGNDVIHAPDRISKAKSAKGSSTDLTSKKASASPTVPLPKGSSSLSLASSSSTASLSPDMSNVLITNSFEPITVDLSHNRLGSSEGSGRCVADIVKEIGKVVALDVGSNGWGEKGALDFAASFAVPLDPPSRSSSSLSASGLNHNPIALLLVTFKCADNMIGNKGGMAVLEALEPCKSLAVLDVSNNALGDKVAPSLASLIQGCPLTTLSIKYNKFKTNGMKRLVLALAQNSTLTDMDFTQCGPGASEKSKELVELLESRENIKRLSIGFNKLPASSFVPRFTSFTAKQRQLVHLDLRGIDLPSKAMCQVLDAIAVNASNTLQELVLNGNALDSKCLEVLIDYLTRSHTLQNLGLRGCGLPRGPLLELLATVKHSSSLHTLDLSGNSLNHRRILDSLCSCIQNNTSLKLLGLAACKLDHAIIGLIGQALQFNKSIEKLHVDGNKLGERGLADLATGLAGNDVLKVISIRSTHISARALLSFVASITAKTQTEVIDAGDNDLPVSNKSFRERLEQFDAVAVKI
jgi:Ran GTPase-activating protein (RanGAP) involved in mRNA processing and transport